MNVYILKFIDPIKYKIKSNIQNGCIDLIFVWKKCKLFTYVLFPKSYKYIVVIWWARVHNWQRMTNRMRFERFYLGNIIKYHIGINKTKLVVINTKSLILAIKYSSGDI